MELSRLIKRYRKAPVLFVEEILGVKPTQQQRQVLEAYSKGKNIAIKSGHGTGKTALLSWLVLLQMFTYPMCKIPITAPTMHQLSDVFWSELSLWLAKSEVLQMLFEKTASKLIPKSDKYKNVWFATLVSARKPENMQGFHGENLLFIVDEASGITDGMFQVIDGALTSKGARLVAVGNPTRTSGYFYHIFKDKDNAFLRFTFSSVESPLVSKRWINNMRKMYGEDSDIFRIRVLGEFPRAEGNYVIPTEWVELAQINEQRIYGDVVIGVDVARSGEDKTAVVVRNGYVVENIYTFNKLDTVEVANEVHKIANLHKAKVVAIEAVGFGAGVLDQLIHMKKQDKRGYKLYQFIPQAKAGNPEQFRNAIAEAWWHLRTLFKPTADGFPLICIPKNELAVQHLTTRDYQVDSDGKIKLTDKVEFKRRMGFSPDIGDAMAIAFYNRLERARHSWKSKIRVLKRGHSEWAELQRL